MARAYGFNEVMRLTDVTRSQLTWWTDRKVIVADLADAEGPGRPRRFSFANLVEVVVARALNSQGVETAPMTGILRALRSAALQDGDSSARWRSFCSPTREPTLVALLDIVLTPEPPGYGGLLFVDELAKIPRAIPANPESVLTFTVYLSSIMKTLEAKTGDRWALSPGELDKLEEDREFLARLRPGEAAIVSRTLPDEQVAFRQQREAELLDARVRKELGLPAVNYRKPVRGADGVPKKRKLLTPEDAKRIRRSGIPARKK